MLLALIYRLALLLMGLLMTRGRNRSLQLEVVVLRQQLRVLEHKLGLPVRKPRIGYCLLP